MPPPPSSRSWKEKNLAHRTHIAVDDRKALEPNGTSRSPVLPALMRLTRSNFHFVAAAGRKIGRRCSLPWHTCLQATALTAVNTSTAALSPRAQKMGYTAHTSYLEPDRPGAVFYGCRFIRSNAGQRCRICP